MPWLSGHLGRLASVDQNGEVAVARELIPEIAGDTLAGSTGMRIGQVSDCAGSVVGLPGR